MIQIYLLTILAKVLVENLNYYIWKFYHPPRGAFTLWMLNLVIKKKTKNYRVLYSKNVSNYVKVET